MSTENININSKNNEVTVRIPKPQIYSIDIDYNKTIYYEAVTGLLRFGDLNLTADEHGVIEREIKNSISTKMLNDDLYSKACESSKDAMDNLLKSILGKDISTNIEII